MVPRNRQRANVLVVDDDPEITHQLTFRSNNGKHFYRGIETAEKGLESLRIDAASPSIDLVIVDFELDDQSAVAFIESAKCIRPEIPYLIWSHYSSEHIYTRLSNLSLDEVLTIQIVAFAAKGDLLSTPQELDKFVDTGLDRFQRQLTTHVAAAVSESMRNVDVALTQVYSASKELEAISPKGAAESFFVQAKVGPLQVRLKRAESYLRRTLGYEDLANSNDHVRTLQALSDVVTAFDDERAELADVKSSLKILVEESDHTRRLQTLETFGRQLKLIRDFPDLQESIAEQAGKCVEFLIYAGEFERASELSAQLWGAANKGWLPVPRFVSAISHAYALASSGKSQLAEHLASSILVEAEARLPSGKFIELSRAVFAELDSCTARE